MGKSRAAKKLDKLEHKTEQLRKKAEKKGRQLQARASDRIEDLNGDKNKGGKKGLVTLVLAAGAAAAYFFKKKRDQELDDALWEEPRSI